MSLILKVKHRVVKNTFTMLCVGQKEKKWCAEVFFRVGTYAVCHTYNMWHPYLTIVDLEELILDSYI